MCGSLTLSAEEVAKRHCVRLQVQNGARWAGPAGEPALPRLGAVVVQPWGTYQTCFAQFESIKGNHWHTYPILDRKTVGIKGFQEGRSRVLRSGSVVLLIVLDAQSRKRSVLVTEKAPERAPWRRQPVVIPNRV